MKTTHFSTKFIITLLLFSCSNMDEIPEKRTQSIRIKAVALLAPQFPSSEGDVLEIFGTISTKLVVINKKSDERILWKKDKSNWVPVGSVETAIYSEGSEHVFTITEEDIQNEVSIEFRAKMWDKDPDGNPIDYLGDSIKSFQVKFNPGPEHKDKPFPIQLKLTDFNGITLLVRFTAEYLID